LLLLLLLLLQAADPGELRLMFILFKKRVYQLVQMDAATYKNACKACRVSLMGRTIDSATGSMTSAGPCVSQCPMQ
jgi:hypothetical protein